MKNNNLNKEFYLNINNYNIQIERFLIELYYREAIDDLVEYSLTNVSSYYDESLETVDISDFIKNIENDIYKNHLLKLII